MNRYFPRLLGVLLLVAGWAGPLAAQNGTVPKHLVDARMLLKSLQPENSSYQHKNTVVKWKGENDAAQSESHTDCSGLVNSVLVHAYPQFDEDRFKKLFGKKRPLAEHYHQAIADGKGFDNVPLIQDVKAGDSSRSNIRRGKKRTPAMSCWSPARPSCTRPATPK